MCAPSYNGKKEAEEKMKRNSEINGILEERFGKDALIALATAAEGIPQVRTVDAYYEDGAFYVVTHALSGKMQQIAKNPAVAVCGDWFTASGEGVNLGAFDKTENAAMAEKLKQVFGAWLMNGHSDLHDPNTVILCIRLKTGVLMSHGRRYEIDFL